MTPTFWVAWVVWICVMIGFRDDPAGPWVDQMILFTLGLIGYTVASKLENWP